MQAHLVGGDGFRYRSILAGEQPWRDLIYKASSEPQGAFQIHATCALALSDLLLYLTILSLLMIQGAFFKTP